MHEGYRSNPISLTWSQSRANIYASDWTIHSRKNSLPGIENSQRFVYNPLAFFSTCRPYHCRTFCRDWQLLIGCFSCGFSCHRHGLLDAFQVKYTKWYLVHFLSKSCLILIWRKDILFSEIFLWRAFHEGASFMFCSMLFTTFKSIK